MRQDADMKKAKAVINRIKKAGYQAYIVGGAVRDYLLEKPIHDIDIATSAKPEMIQQLFSKVIPIGINHGTVLVRYQHQSFEITTFRTEKGYSDFRHPDEVYFVESIEEDLSRRDFTINAMALAESGEIIDPFDGQADLKLKRIRCVGQAKQRYSEDPLRILRALRFVSQLNFNLDQQSYDTIKTYNHWIKKIAIERITVELVKLFQGQASRRAVNYAIQLGVFQQLPVFEQNEKLVQPLLDYSQTVDYLVEIWTYLILKVEDAPLLSNWCKAYRLSNKEKLVGQTLLEAWRCYQEESLSKWLLYQLPPDLDDVFIRLISQLTNTRVTTKQLIAIRESLPIVSRKQLDINGDRLIKLYPNRTRGPWIKLYLTEIEYEVVQKNLNNDYKEIKEWILSCHPPERS